MSSPSSHPATTTSPSSPSLLLHPRLAVLSRLEGYADATVNVANVEFKECLWLLTRARLRRKGDNNVVMGVETAFSAGSLREEWTARRRLFDANDGDEGATFGELVDEEDDDDERREKSRPPATTSTVPEWRLRDVLEEKEDAAGNVGGGGSAAATDVLVADPTASTGLRRRKTPNDRDRPNDDDDGEASSWTREGADEEGETAASSLRRDPIEYFGGLPPRDLKAAQEKAVRALRGYVAAANEAAAILRIIVDDERRRRRRRPEE